MPKEGLLKPPHTVFIPVLMYTGATMLPVGLGAWKNDPGHGNGVVKYALSFGYHHTDCAVIYWDWRGPEGEHGTRKGGAS